MIIEFEYISYYEQQKSVGWIFSKKSFTLTIEPDKVPTKLHITLTLGNKVTKT
jgi:hypothetical protein